MTNKLTDATNTTLSLPNLQYTNKGDYFVAVTNSAGFAISSNAFVDVNRQPTAQITNAGGQEGRQVSIAVQKLSTHWSDPDTNAISFDSVYPTTTNGVSVTTDNTNIYCTPALEGADEIQYRIKDSRNGLGLGKIVLNVIPSNVPTGTLTGIQPAIGGMRLTFTGLPNCAYGLERATNLTGNWEPLATMFADEGGQGEHTDSNAPTACGFYRLR